MVSLADSLEAAAFPGNFPAVLASGKPLIYVGKKGGKLGSLIESEGCGMVVQADDKHAIAAAIAQLHAIPESRTDMGHRARALYEKMHARKPALEAWSGLLMRIAGG